MRPGAKGFLKVMVALVLLSLVFVAYATWTEFGTIGDDDPISHYMHDMSKIGVFLFGLGMGTLASSIFWLAVAWAFHFWFEAKARFRRQDDEIGRFGDPTCAAATPPEGPWYGHAQRLWRIHTGGKP